MVDDELLVAAVLVPLLIAVVDLIAAGANTDIIVIDTATNVIINIFGDLSIATASEPSAAISILENFTFCSDKLLSAALRFEFVPVL